MKHDSYRVYAKGLRIYLISAYNSSVWCTWKQLCDFSLAVKGRTDNI